ncbi:YlmC/YmxH family sporulation protein [Anaerobacillus sp. MEB173]|uniref:YlmC/YmxH family sporulation protein n=1 Tax=Anaerobacillus sp. MEB173 TaxID=3383345 RepID=UPI003F91A905
MIKISELQSKDIINISEGRRLGNLGDLDINLETGRIDAIIIGGTGRMMGLLGRDEEIVIPWRNIIKIGSDCILVRTDLNR